ncbi:hypothetical protein [Thermomonas flagellata]|uniref:hypothetical protein n=1 Tax=Thermomonas flagellata TaxID=2888524 RepID=UPI001F04B551|nr:hypothetical protein [Thermomonas flagellata]
MLVRGAVVMLAVLNLGLGLWWLAGAPGRVPPSRLPALDAPPLQLAMAAPPAPAAMPAPVAPSPLPTATAALAAAASAAEAAPVCLRLGPFADAAARAALAARLPAAVEAQPEDVPTRAARGWKVFLPPLASREAAQAEAARLRAAGVRDLFVLAEGEDANAIALGRFGSEDGARRRLAELQALGVQAQAAPVGGSPAQAWLRVRAPDPALAAQVAALAPSREIACAAGARATR